MTAAVLVLAGALAALAPEEARVTEVVAARAVELGRPLLGDQARRIAGVVIRTSRATGIPAAVLLGVIEVESAYQRRATSSVGCRGLTQLAPPTAAGVARTMGVRRYDLERPEDNVAIGGAYLALLLARYGRLDHALSAFNRGMGAFERGGRPVGRYVRLVLLHAEDVQKQLHATTQKGTV